MYNAILEIVADVKPRTILEVGSANGAGSTQAFVAAAQGLEVRPKMVCLEVDESRFFELKENVSRSLWVTPIRAATVPVGQYISDADISSFMELAANLPYAFNILKFPVQTVRDWRKEELLKIVESDIQQDGLSSAKELLGGVIDIAFLDGSAFTGMADLRAVRRESNVIVLDDILDIKNWDAYSSLCLDGQFALVANDTRYRNGFAVFKRRVAL